MKRSLLLIVLLLPFITHAQAIRTIAYTVDTFRINDGAIPTQRSTDKELTKYVMNGGSDYQVALSLSKLQQQLLSLQTNIQKNRLLAESDFTEEYLQKIKKADNLFDLTRYENELAFYKKNARVRERQYDTTQDEELNKGMKVPRPIFIDCPLSINDVHAFNKMIMDNVKGYHQTFKIEEPDNHDGLVYTYTSINGKTLTIRYKMEKRPGMPELKLEGFWATKEQTITGEFATMVQLYNNMFDKEAGEMEVLLQQEIYGSFYRYQQLRQYKFLRVREGIWSITIY